MIHFQNVTIANPGAGQPILRNASFRFHSHERIGIFANAGTGKTVLTKALCGIEPPQRGRVTTDQITWPLAFAGFLHPNLTVLKNLEFVARLNRQDIGHFVCLVASLADIGDKIWVEMRDIPPTQRAVIAYMCCMAMPSSMLVADGTLTVGDDHMRRKCEALLDQRLLQGGLVFLSRNPRQMRQYCHRFFALRNGRLIPCESPELAQVLLAKEEEHV